MSNNKPAWTEVLKQWEPSAGSEAVTSAASTALFPVTNNVTRETFARVKHNPGITAAQVVAMLPQQKPTSVTSLLAQMVKNGLCRNTDGKFYALVDEYLPLKRAYAKYATVKKVKAKAKPAAPAPSMAQQLAPAREQRLATASSLLMSLNVVEARLLYDELKKVFN
jgi:hypothetical protein